MNTPQNQFDTAHQVLKKHYKDLVEQMAEEIIEHREDFESPGFGSQAEDIIDKYSRKLYSVGITFCNLSQFVSREKPQGKEALTKDEFRCFGCGSVIRREDQVCRVCGWSWK